MWAIIIVHPRSDVVAHENRIDVDCPGLKAHRLKVSRTEEPMNEATLNLNTTEPGLFEFLFCNPGHDASGVDVELGAQGSRIGFTTSILSAEEVDSLSLLHPGPWWIRP